MVLLSVETINFLSGWRLEFLKASQFKEDYNKIRNLTERYYSYICFVGERGSLNC